MFFDRDETAPFSIESVEDYPTIRIVRLRGAIDQATVTEIERFRKWVARHHGFKHKHILLDFKNVTHVDTAAVAQILQAVAELKAAHFRLVAVHLNDTVRGMFQVLKVEKWIALYENESDAVEDFKRHVEP
jgi:anti-anti-sigma factor